MKAMINVKVIFRLEDTLNMHRSNSNLPKNQPNQRQIRWTI